MPIIFLLIILILKDIPHELLFMKHLGQANAIQAQQQHVAQQRQGQHSRHTMVLMKQARAFRTLPIMVISPSLLSESFHLMTVLLREQSSHLQWLFPSFIFLSFLFFFEPFLLILVVASYDGGPIRSIRFLGPISSFILLRMPGTS